MNESKQDNKSASLNPTTPSTDKKDKRWIKRTTQWVSSGNEEWQSLPGGCRALFVSFLFLAFGLLTLWIMRSMLNIQQDAVLVAILLVPVIIYLILSGKLLEISAGGVSAKFNDTAQKPLFSEDEMNAMAMEEEQVAIIMKKGLAKLQEQLHLASSSRYIVLTVVLGNPLIPGKSPYNSSDLHAYLKALSQYRNFTFLAILEPNGKVYGYKMGWQAIQIIELEKEMTNPNIPDDSSFVTAINQGQKDELQRYGLIETTVKTTDTYISVLKKMTTLKIDILIVTDEDGIIKNVIEREQVLSKLILALTK